MPRGFCTTFDQTKVDKLATDLDEKLREMEKPLVTQADYEAVKEEAENLRKEVETRVSASLEVEASKQRGNNN